MCGVGVWRVPGIYQGPCVRLVTDSEAWAAGEVGSCGAGPGGEVARQGAAAGVVELWSRWGAQPAMSPTGDWSGYMVLPTVEAISGVEGVSYTCC